MRVYFLAERPAALFVGGAYFGRADSFARSAEVALTDGILLSFVPSGDFLPLQFTLGEDTLFSPPRGISLYRAENLLAVRAHGFLHADPALRVIWQTQLGGARLTLFRQGALQLTVQTQAGFRIAELPDYLQDCTAAVQPHGFLLQGERGFCDLSPEGEMRILSEGRILKAEETLRAEVPLGGCLGHTALCEWKEGKLLSCTLRAKRQAEGRSIALALLESARIGADCTPFLHPSLRGKAGELLAFLGSFEDVFLPKEADTVGIVCRLRERVYALRSFRVELRDGLVSNLIPA